MEGQMLSLAWNKKYKGKIIKKQFQIQVSMESNILSFMIGDFDMIACLCKVRGLVSVHTGRVQDEGNRHSKRVFIQFLQSNNAILGA